MAEQQSLVRDPLCPICRQPLFGRVIWIRDTGNCHDTCVQEVVTEEIAARWTTPADETA